MRRDNKNTRASQRQRHAREQGKGRRRRENERRRAETSMRQGDLCDRGSIETGGERCEYFVESWRKRIEIVVEGALYLPDVIP